MTILEQDVELTGGGVVAARYTSCLYKAVQKFNQVLTAQGQGHGDNSKTLPKTYIDHGGRDHESPRLNFPSTTNASRQAI